VILEALLSSTFGQGCMCMAHALLQIPTVVKLSVVIENGRITDCKMYGHWIMAHLLEISLLIHGTIDKS